MGNDLRIGILGGAGRMGQMNIRQVAMTDGCVVAGATARPGSEAVGQDAGELAGIGARSNPHAEWFALIQRARS